MQLCSFAIALSVFFHHLCFGTHLLCYDMQCVQQKTESIDLVIQKAIADKAFPAACLLVIYNGKTQVKKCYGTLDYESDVLCTQDTLFDMASLTKPIVTAFCILRLYQDKLLDIDDPVSRYVQDIPINTPMTIRSLLCHESGLLADWPSSWLQDSDFIKLSQEEKQQKLWDFIFQNSLNLDQRKYIYSDLGYILLGKIVEKVQKLSFEHYAQKILFDPLHMKNSGFCPLTHGYSLNCIAPTENDNYLKRGKIHGQVHDEKAYVLGGIAGHAGLFSTLDDMQSFAYFLINKGTFQNHEILQKHSFELMCTPAYEHSLYSCGWSFDTPTISCIQGCSLSKKSICHLGFTGTGIWYDPEKNLVIVLLTNRVCPTRENIQIREVRRQVIHEVLKMIDKEPALRAGS